MPVQARANKYNFAVALFAALGSSTYGYNVAIRSSVLGLPSFYPYFKIDPSSSKGSAEAGAINGLWSAGGAIGCWMVMFCLDYFGRVRFIQLVCVLNVITAAIEGGAVDIEMLLVAQFFNGIGTGAILTTIPIFQAEIAPARQRGRITGLHGFLNVSGSAIANWVGYAAWFEKNPKIQWRLCLCLQMLAPLLLLCGTPWMPESPRWLIKKGRDAEGMAVLEKLHKTPDDPQATGAHLEFLQIQKQIELEHAQGLDSMKLLFKKPSFRRRMLTGFFVQSICQTTGVLTIAFYQVTLDSNVGITGSLSLLLLACWNTLAAIMNGVNSLIVDRVGRIRFLTIGIIGCMVMLSCLTAMIAECGHTKNKTGNSFAIVFLFGFVFFYGLCLDATSYIYCSEIFPTAIRAKGNGFSISALYLNTLLFTQVAPTAFNAVGWRYYLVFICLPFAGLFILVKYLPETARLSLEEISGKFGDEIAFEVNDQNDPELSQVQQQTKNLSSGSADDEEKTPHEAVRIDDAYSKQL